MVRRRVLEDGFGKARRALMHFLAGRDRQLRGEFENAKPAEQHGSLASAILSLGGPGLFDKTVQVLLLRRDEDRGGTLVHEMPNCSSVLRLS